MKILAIGAHQDDNEFRVGGMTVKWVKAGYEVAYLSLTNGSGGHHLLSKEETIATRAKESAAVAKHLGVLIIHICTFVNKKFDCFNITPFACNEEWSFIRKREREKDRNPIVINKVEICAFRDEECFRLARVFITDEFVEWCFVAFVIAHYFCAA